MVNKKFKKACNQPIAVSNLIIQNEQSIAMKYILRNKYHVKHLRIHCNTKSLLQNLYQISLKHGAIIITRINDKDLEIFRSLCENMNRFAEIFNGAKYGKLIMQLHVKQIEFKEFHNMMRKFINYFKNGKVNRINFMIDLEIIEQEHNILNLLKIIQSNNNSNSEMKWYIQYPTKNIVNQKELMESTKSYVDTCEQSESYDGELSYFYRLYL